MDFLFRIKGSWKCCLLYVFKKKWFGVKSVEVGKEKIYYIYWVLLGGKKVKGI